MPMLDMPLEQLEKFNGRTPRPADFDEYWERGLEQMHSLDKNVELIKSKFSSPGAECFDIYFTGCGGARVHAQYMRPVNMKNIPAVICFPGYSSPAGPWCGRLSYVSAGMAVAAFDCRGQADGISEDAVCVKGNTLNGHIVRGLDDPNPDNLMFRNVFLDTAELAEIIMGLPEIDAERVACMGASQGGGLALACASLVPEINRVSVAYPFLCDYQRAWEMDMVNRAYAELKAYFKYRDPRHIREKEIFTKLGYIDVHNLAPRIKAKVNWGVGLMDSCCPPSTQYAAYNAITSEKKIYVYPDFDHEDLQEFWDIGHMFVCEMLK